MCLSVNDRFVTSSEKKLKHRPDAHWTEENHADANDSHEDPALQRSVDGSSLESDDAIFSARPARILALDVGSKRIGVAVTDAMGITAQGLDTIQRQNKRIDMEALKQVLDKYEIREIVIGLPLRLSGAEGTQSEKMRAYAAELHAHFGLTVHLWDERWTSTEANRLLRETDLSIKKRGQAVDRMAAILILQSWMQAHPGR
jgi:putative holliday junction resolvase